MKSFDTHLAPQDTMTNTIVRDEIPARHPPPASTEVGKEFDPPLIQTKLRGTHEQEYDIYVACAQSLGWSVKSFEEWITS